MRYLSVCSGIESASCAWHPLGWQAVAFSEIESFPSAVLSHHYPTVPNWGDMTRFAGWPNETIDVLVGGTPCQSFSVAGLRKGLDDPRGNLMLTYLAIARRYRPAWVVWENLAPTIDAGQPHTVAFANTAGATNLGISETGEAPPITTRNGDPGNVMLGMQVRRLTPTECERLMGFPDGYTAITYRGKPAADGPRYKALGNSKAVPVVRWIGERIATVAAISNAAKVA